ncbi:DUF4326 domain-containing protein (plasmid) [Azospirillum argentinense]|uniref:DUF4326 domain-containing protein n=1 Tax=Azospirillum argentinense TaxID=2970906 RepID=A0A4D8PYG4_9PROT|nr:DUF4326 domain-containing protein [Azospirillum argentinense]QCO00516.1 DUF4326 domain-containing protein [Azospirillum argentinense]
MSEAPKGIQRRRTKGWRMPPNTTSVTRPGVFGNPFPGDINPAAAVDRYERWLAGGMSRAEFADHATWIWGSGHADREAILRRLPELRGKNLACFCAEGSPCHRDVLLRLANGTVEIE